MDLDSNDGMGGKRGNLPVTTGVGITETAPELFWLKGVGILYVLIVFIAVGGIVGSMPLAVFSAFCTFVFIRTMIDKKPRHYLLHMLQYYFVLKKNYSYRPSYCRQKKQEPTK